jgi:hypothetical protein
VSWTDGGGARGACSEGHQASDDTDGQRLGRENPSPIWRITRRGSDPLHPALDVVALVLRKPVLRLNDLCQTRWGDHQPENEMDNEHASGSSRPRFSQRLSSTLPDYLDSKSCCTTGI